MFPITKNNIILNNKDSNKIRNLLYRIISKSLNKDDIKIIKHYNKLSQTNKNKFIWKD